ncbi:hypothetical protein Tco_0944577, partial [Tanacetum coccineum]
MMSYKGNEPIQEVQDTNVTTDQGIRTSTRERNENKLDGVEWLYYYCQYRDALGCRARKHIITPKNSNEILQVLYVDKHAYTHDEEGGGIGINGGDEDMAAYGQEGNQEGGGVEINGGDDDMVADGKEGNQEGGGVEINSGGDDMAADGQEGVQENQ